MQNHTCYTLHYMLTIETVEVFRGLVILCRSFTSATSRCKDELQLPLKISRAIRPAYHQREYCGPDSTGLVTIDGVVYRIVDIGMRMLQPHELYRAQGFPDWYIIDRDYRGVKYAKDKQVARCGNAVPPPFAEALVRANLPEICQQHGRAA
ncbi:hypothetical protein BvCmsSINP024_03909 [Escherichia coli]|nr:hypothetical protein BvCmsSINP024_03909 [Escherichia coli]